MAPISTHVSRGHTWTLASCEPSCAVDTIEQAVDRIVEARIFHDRSRHMLATSTRGSRGELTQSGSYLAAPRPHALDERNCSPPCWRPRSGASQHWRGRCPEPPADPHNHCPGRPREVPPVRERYAWLGSAPINTETTNRLAFGQRRRLDRTTRRGCLKFRYLRDALPRLVRNLSPPTEPSPRSPVDTSSLWLL
jgi:hypothetical protein